MRAVADALPGPRVHVARQPIHDGKGSLVGYELLFRDTSSALSATQDDDSATTATILAAFSEFGAEELLGGRPGFINLTRAFLTGSLPLPFSPEAAVLEVVESVRLDHEVIKGALRLAQDGYRLALDDFTWSDAAVPLLAVADIVKIDVLAMDWPEVIATVARCKEVGDVRLLAEKVENFDVLRRCLNEGFELFQGYHLGRPETLTAQTLSPSQLTAMALIGRLSDPQITTAEIDEQVRKDPALVYRLLRIANSAASGLGRKVSTIRDALVMVGVNRLRSWLVLLALSPDGGEDVGLITALTRARTCELVARRIGMADADTAFTAGLLHGVADALALTPTMLLERMPALDTELAAAIFGAPGRLREILDLVIAYERVTTGELNGFSVPLGTLAEAYMGALAWTTQATEAFGDAS